MKIRLSVCSDYHLHPQYPIDASGIDAIVRRAREAKADVMLHCGDFILDLEHQKAALDAFLHNSAGIPAFGCYGNHELELTDSVETMNAAYGIDNSYYYRDVKGFRFVMLDTNFFVKDGVFQRYPGYSVGGPSWDYDLNMLGEAQLYWLRQTLLSSPYPCIILSHACLDEKPSCAWDAPTVRKIIHDVNAKFPKRVLLCLNGHIHSDSVVVLDNVVYFNINATYMGAWRLQKHNLFPPEFAGAYASADNCAFFADPLNAIVTVDSDGTVDIEGMETTYLYGVTPADLGLPTETPNGSVVPRISDAHIVLN